MIYFTKTRLLASVLLLLVSCGTASESSTVAIDSPTPTSSTSPAPDEPAPSASATPEEPEAATPQSTVISAEGIGEARLGMTLGELKQQLGSAAEFTVQSPFIVDFDAIAVQQGGEVQYYILYLAGQTLGDEDAIQGLLTENPEYKTAEGVGAGTTVAQAEVVYGQATLSYHTQNESREYARFERQPAPNISFATGNASQDAAGIYANPTSEFNQTQEFQPEATIKSVLLVCLAEQCAAP